MKANSGRRNMTLILIWKCNSYAPYQLKWIALKFPVRSKIHKTNRVSYQEEELGFDPLACHMLYLCVMS